MSVRKVVTRSGGHSRGFMPSIKNQRPVAWESQLELQFYQVLELSPDVRTFVVQPTREQIWVDGAPAIYIPDVKVKFANGTDAFFEVKPALKCRTRRIASRLVAIRARFEETGRRFHLITDTWLQAEPRRSNVEWLMYHRRGTLLSQVERMRLMRTVKAHQPENVAELIGLVGSENAWLLLGLGLVGVDIELSMNDASHIFLTGGHRHAHLFT
jgi:hypothetical protein